MRIVIAAVGRMKAGPERTLLQRYVDQAGQAGRRLGLTFTVREFPESRAATAAGRAEQEATTLLVAVTPQAVLVALDEAGKSVGSVEFARRLGGWREDNRGEVVFAIGGADGHGSALLKRADLRLSFSALTWPHQLVRVMLAEQFYRAVTILTGHPYHRD
jgi:23S rRNA (pseudouridine1915-N3)-methyltransferase